MITWRLHHNRRGVVFPAFCALVVALSPRLPLAAQPLDSLPGLTNIQLLVSRVVVGLDPNSGQGPKGIKAADFDQDGWMDLAVGNTDGSVTVLYGLGKGKFTRAKDLLTQDPTLPTPASLRGIVVADFNQDQHPDIAVASPYEGKVFVFFAQPGNRDFSPPSVLVTWRGARNLEVGDFDGDGRMDLVVAGPNALPPPSGGLRQYRGLHGGTFSNVTEFAALNFSFALPDKFPKPFYSLARFRPPDSSRDWLIAGHAEGTNIWILKPDPAGTLEIHSTLGGQANVHGLAVGPVYSSIASGANDLVTLLRDAGVVQVHRRGTNASLGLDLLPFDPERDIREEIPGGPRALSLVDLNADGWNDLVVVVRNFDIVLTYLNDRNGRLVPVSSRPVGSSPRELVTADFDGDQRPDAAVMNRGSSDVTILLASEQAVGYRAVDGLYLVDGQVAGLTVRDFNNDGFDDVIQLHRASGDFSVRLTRPGGTGILEAPIYYTVGNVPAAQVIVDVNNDGLLDVVTANLGTRIVERGSVSVSLGLTNAPGKFDDERRVNLPLDVEGRLFALVPGNFDHEGAYDLVAGFLDGKLAFFHGSGNGEFTHVRTRRILMDGAGDAQPRSLTAADFDRDGDLDLAGLDASGEMWVMENPSSVANPATNLFNALGVAVRRFLPPDTGFGGRKIAPFDHNKDGIPDLVVGSGQGAWLYLGLGGPGATNFVTPPTQLAGLSNAVSDFFLKDLDGDNNPDIVVSCHDRDCLTVFSGRDSLSRGLPYDAPSSRFIATGDLDGDKQPDFVGSGRVLWTSLSTRPARSSPPLVPSGDRPRMTNLVINEILASNTDLPLDADDGRMSDWLELHNGESGARSLAYWKVQLSSVNDSGHRVTSDFTLPPTAFLAPGSSLVIVCSENRRTLYHTGFRLPATGGTITLRDPAGNKVDEVIYPPQRPNISYARYRDALRSFVFNPFPSPGRSNPVNGTAEPNLKFAGVDPVSFDPNQPIRVYADVADDIGGAAVFMHYQTLAWGANSPRTQIRLFDDGQHGDREAGDGFFATELPFTLTTPTELQFFFELTDLGDATITAPEDPEFGTPDALGNTFQLGFIQPLPLLEISEIMAWNKSGLQDGTNRPDWLEVRNLSSSRIDVSNVSVSQQIGENPRFTFPTRYMMEPGEHFVILCDNDPARGVPHAPIALNRDGDTVMLTGLTTNRSRTLIDVVSYGLQQPDVAWARLGAGSPFWSTTPTPTHQNVSPRIVGDANRAWVGQIRSRDDGILEGAIGIPTQRGVPCTVESATALNPNNWTLVEHFIGDGIERVYTWSLTNATFFRWR